MQELRFVCETVLLFHLTTLDLIIDTKDQMLKAESSLRLSVISKYKRTQFKWTRHI